MMPVARLIRRLRHLVRRRRTEAEMAEEMRFHLEARAADFAADGLPGEEARYAAQRRFGNLGSIQERARDVRALGWLERALKDFRRALRQLARSPGFTVLAIVTLGLGIGANTSMFSVLNGIWLRPLPYPDSGHLHRVYRATAQNREGYISPADYLDLQRAGNAPGDAAAYTAANVSLAEPDRPAEFAYAARSTVNLLSLLGVTPQLGRGFRTGEDTPGRDRVVILSQRTWRSRFGGARNVIGRMIRIDGEAHEIIGVLPVAFNDWRHLGMVDLFRPLAFSRDDAPDRHSTFLRVIIRRAAASSPAEVASFIATFGQRLATEFPDPNAESTWRSVPLQQSIQHQNGQSMVVMLIGLSGFVLLIACSNLANLLLARTIARAREFAVRAALGASRTQLLRPLIAESLLLAFAGGAFALLVALWFHDWAALRSTGENGEQVIFQLDPRVFAWTFAASLVTALAFGVAPALFALRLDLNGVLKSGGRGLTGGRGHQRFRQFLIIGQFGLAMVLLAGAGLFSRGFHDLNHRRSGWQSEHLVTGTILLPATKYADADQITSFQRRALERLAALPGVASVSLSAYTPFLNWPDVRRFLVAGRERPLPGREPAAVVNTVSADYFDTFGTRVIAGHAFTGRENAGSARVFIVGQTAARALFGDESPLGQRIALADGDSPRWGEIVGVVSDVQSVVAEAAPIDLQIYQSMAQAPLRQNEIAVRTDGVAPAALVDRIAAVMAELDRDLPVRKLQPADATILRANYQLGLLRDMLAVIALLGLGLASLGIYGIIARTMAQRTDEFAIRLALGAGVRDLTAMVLASGVKLALVGSTLGLLGTFGVTRVFALAFPGMRTDGVGVMIGTTLLLVAVALVASWLPARRAGRLDPTLALRAE